MMLPKRKSKTEALAEEPANPPEGASYVPKAAKRQRKKNTGQNNSERASTEATAASQSLQGETASHSRFYTALPLPSPTPHLDLLSPIASQPQVTMPPTGHRNSSNASRESLSSYVASRIEAAPPRRPLMQVVRESTTFPDPPEMHQNDGQDLGQTLSATNKDQLLARILLNLSYECERHQIDLPWADVASRLQPGMEKGKLHGFMVKLRSIIMKAGYVVPPLEEDRAAKDNLDIRGYFHDPSWAPDMPPVPVSFEDDNPIPSTWLYLPNDIYVEQGMERSTSVSKPKLKAKVLRRRDGALLHPFSLSSPPTMPIGPPMGHFPILRSQSHLWAFGNDPPRGVPGPAPAKQSRAGQLMVAPDDSLSKRWNEKHPRYGPAQHTALWTLTAQQGQQGLPAPPQLPAPTQGLSELPQPASPSRALEDYCWQGGGSQMNNPGASAVPRGEPSTFQGLVGSTSSPIDLTMEDTIYVQKLAGT